MTDDLPSRLRSTRFSWATPEAVKLEAAECIEVLYAEMATLKELMAEEYERHTLPGGGRDGAGICVNCGQMWPCPSSLYMRIPALAAALRKQT